MDDNKYSDAFFIPPSPGSMGPSPDASLFYEYSSCMIPSPEAVFSLWNFSDGNYDGNDSSSTLSLLPSPSRLLGWPCEKTTFHPMLKGGSMDYDNSLMLLSPSPKAPSPAASSSCIFSPSNPELRQCSRVRIISRLKMKLRIAIYFKRIYGDYPQQVNVLISLLVIMTMVSRLATMKQSPAQLQLLTTMKQRFHRLFGKERNENIYENKIIYENVLNSLRETENVLSEGGLHSAYPENECTGKTSKRKCRNIKKTLEDSLRENENVLSEGGIHSAYLKKECTRKTSKRKCGNIQKSITLEDLQQFSGRRMDAARSFGVSVSKLKRQCRQLGITDWRHRKIINNNQYLSKPKDIIESVHGEGAVMGDQMPGGCMWELNHEQIAFPPEFERGTQMEITPVGDLFVSSTHERIEAGHPLELPIQPSELNLSVACSRADAVSFTPEGELLMDHNISATEAFNSEQGPESNRASFSYCDPAPKQGKATAAVKMSLDTKTQHTRTMTMKAEYGKDMIRFQLSLTSGINELRKEVAKRLMLEGRNVIRLLIHDIRPNSGAPDKAVGNIREIGL